MRRRLLACALALIFCCPHALAAAQTGCSGDITRRCHIRLPGGKSSRRKVFDRNYATYWCRYGPGEVQVTIHLPEDVKAGGLYLCFAMEPEQISLYRPGDDKPLAQLMADGIPHKYLPFRAGGELRLVILGTRAGFQLSELFVVAGEEPPGWVQRWQPPLEQADLLVVVAHPDDELLWMGGALPYYSAVRGLDVAVAYMTCANPLRRHEALNGWWTAGIRHYPYIGSFRDKSMGSLQASLALWGGQEKASAHVMDLVRRLKPLVLLSHDLAGEYGHSAHIITARAAEEAALRGGQPDAFPESAAAHGLWQPCKLYLHLYGQNTIHMDWQMPVPALGGDSALAIAQAAFEQHRSQRSRWRVASTGPYSPSAFGLVHSLVGPDVQGDDFFEHVAMREGCSSILQQTK